MKYRTAIMLVMVANCLFAQDFQSQFLNACESNDTTKQREVLIKWENKDPNDPELYTSRFNYHFTKSRKEVLELSNDEPNGDALVLTDSLGKNSGFIGSKIIYNPAEIEKALSCIEKGIEQYPYRLDMRFGKIYVLGQLEDWDSFTNEIIAIIGLSATKSSPWLWTNNEEQEADNEFMLSVMQDYQLQLYNTQNDSLLLNMRRIANTVLENNPNHIESLSNLSITYSLLGEFDKALNPLLKAELIAPDDYVVIANIAGAYKEIGNTNKSIEYYKKLLEFDEVGVADYAKQQLELLSKK